MDEKLLEIKNLSVCFHTSNGRVDAVNGVSWELSRGEVLAILGESGSGKSVSASAIMNLLDAPPAEIKSGEILFEGRNLLDLPENERRELNGKRIAMIFQDPLSYLNPVYSVGWQIVEALTTHGHQKALAQSEMLSLLQKVGIPEPKVSATKYPHQFSGGQRQRIMIAMALALKPDVLIADEPTTALDVTVQAQILRLLKKLQKETNLGLLIITHDLGVVAELADRVIVMNNGKIVESGTTREIYKSPQNAYTKRLISSAPGNGEMSSFEVKEAPVLRVENLRKRYGAFSALDGISFELFPGETLAVVGESGSGKSTTAKLMLRLEDADTGKVIYGGVDLLKISERDLFAIRREIQMVFQDPTQSLNPRMSIFQIISEAWQIHRGIVDRQLWREKAGQLLLKVGLKLEHLDRYPHEFSGGQRQRIAIARALALEPKIIICDEAVSALDVSIQSQVIQLLKELQTDLGISYIFIAHDLPVVRDFADRVIVMQNGQIMELGTVKEIFNSPKNIYTQNLLAASLSPDPDIQQLRRNQLLKKDLEAK